MAPIIRRMALKLWLSILGLSITSSWSTLAIRLRWTNTNSIYPARKWINACSDARPAPQVVDGGAFAYTALLVCYTDYLWFCHFEVSSFSINLAACGVTGGYVGGMKQALVLAPAPPLKVFSIMKCVCLLPKSLNSCGFARLSLWTLVPTKIDRFRHYSLMWFW